MSVSIKKRINDSLNKYGIAILPPMDAFASMKILKENDFHFSCCILDPWYNKGIGGVLPDAEYDAFIKKLLDNAGDLSDLIYLWGFPEIIGPYVRYAPANFKMSAWLTWFYKNCPSVIRGWRSSQNACIQFVKKGKSLHPENFLSDEQKEKLKTGKMRFIPGPSTVIEEPLIVGFVGKNERTGHPSQKPEAVYQKTILMATSEEDIIVDVMAGSGTTGAVCKKNNRKCVLCDMNEDYISMMEKRLEVPRIKF